MLTKLVDRPAGLAVSVTESHVKVVPLPDLPDSRPGISLHRFPDGVPGVGDGLAVLHQNRPEGHGKENVVFLNKGLNALRRVFFPQVFYQEVTRLVHKEGIHHIVLEAVRHHVAGVKPAELPVPDHNAVIPGEVIIGVHSHHGVDFLRHGGGIIQVWGAEAVVRQFPPELGGVGNLHLGKAAAHAVHILFPEDGHDAVIQVILKVTGKGPLVEVRFRIKGHNLFRTEETGIPGPLNQRHHRGRVLHRAGPVTGFIGHRRSQRVLRDAVVRRGLRLRFFRRGGNRLRLSAQFTADVLCLIRAFIIRDFRFSARKPGLRGFRPGYCRFCGSRGFRRRIRCPHGRPHQQQGDSTRQQDKEDDAEQNLFSLHSAFPRILFSLYFNTALQKLQPEIMAGCGGTFRRRKDSPCTLRRYGLQLTHYEKQGE